MSYGRADDLLRIIRDDKTKQRFENSTKITEKKLLKTMPDFDKEHAWYRAFDSKPLIRIEYYCSLGTFFSGELSEDSREVWDFIVELCAICQGVIGEDLVVELVGVDQNSGHVVQNEGAYCGPYALMYMFLKRNGTRSYADVQRTIYLAGRKNLDDAKRTVLEKVITLSVKNETLDGSKGNDIVKSGAFTGFLKDTMILDYISESARLGYAETDSCVPIEGSRSTAQGFAINMLRDVVSEKHTRFQTIFNIDDSPLSHFAYLWVEFDTIAPGFNPEKSAWGRGVLTKPAVSVPYTPLDHIFGRGDSPPKKGTYESVNATFLILNKYMDVVRGYGPAVTESVDAISDWANGILMAFQYSRSDPRRVAMALSLELVLTLIDAAVSLEKSGPSRVGPVLAAKRVVDAASRVLGTPETDAPSNYGNEGLSALEFWYKVLTIWDPVAYTRGGYFAEVKRKAPRAFDDDYEQERGGGVRGEDDGDEEEEEEEERSEYYSNQFYNSDSMSSGEGAVEAREARLSDQERHAKKNRAPKNAHTLPPKPIVKVGPRGRGLFAERDYRKGEFVTLYKGEPLTSEEASDQNRSPMYMLKSPRALTPGGGSVVKASNGAAAYAFDALEGPFEETALGRYINGPKDSYYGPAEVRANVYVGKPKDGYPRIITRFPVKKGEEFILSYGPGYWKRMARFRENHPQDWEKLSTSSSDPYNDLLGESGLSGAVPALPREAVPQSKPPPTLKKGGRADMWINRLARRQSAENNSPRQGPVTRSRAAEEDAETGVTTGEHPRLKERDHRAGPSEEVESTDPGARHRPKNSTAYYPRVDIKPTFMLAGQMGVFAAENIAKGTTVSIYTGQVLDRVDADAIEKQEMAKPTSTTRRSSYFVAIAGTEKVIDGSQKDSAAHLINHYACLDGPPNVMRGPNCELLQNGEASQLITVVAVRNIKANEQLLLDYGHSYWRDVQKDELRLTREPSMAAFTLDAVSSRERLAFGAFLHMSMAGGVGGASGEGFAACSVAKGVVECSTVRRIVALGVVCVGPISHYTSLVFAYVYGAPKVLCDSERRFNRLADAFVRSARAVLSIYGKGPGQGTGAAEVDEDVKRKILLADEGTMEKEDVPRMYPRDFSEEWRNSVSPLPERGDAFGAVEAVTAKSAAPAAIVVGESAAEDATRQPSECLRFLRVCRAVDVYLCASAGAGAVGAAPAERAHRLYFPWEDAKAFTSSGLALFRMDNDRLPSRDFDVREMVGSGCWPYVGNPLPGDLELAVRNDGPGPWRVLVAQKQYSPGDFVTFFEPGKWAYPFCLGAGANDPAAKAEEYNCHLSPLRYGPQTAIVATKIISPGERICFMKDAFNVTENFGFLKGFHKIKLRPYGVRFLDLHMGGAGAYYTLQEVLTVTSDLLSALTAIHMKRPSPLQSFPELNPESMFLDIGAPTILLALQISMLKKCKACVWYDPEYEEIIQKEMGETDSMASFMITALKDLIVKPMCSYPIGANSSATIASTCPAPPDNTACVHCWDGDDYALVRIADGTKVPASYRSHGRVVAQIANRAVMALPRGNSVTVICHRLFDPVIDSGFRYAAKHVNTFGSGGTRPMCLIKACMPPGARPLGAFRVSPRLSWKKGNVYAMDRVSPVDRLAALVEKMASSDTYQSSISTSLLQALSEKLRGDNVVSVLLVGAQMSVVVRLISDMYKNFAAFERCVRVVVVSFLDASPENVSARLPRFRNVFCTYSLRAPEQFLQVAKPFDIVLCALSGAIFDDCIAPDLVGLLGTTPTTATVFIPRSLSVRVCQAYFPELEVPFNADQYDPLIAAMQDTNGSGSNGVNTPPVSIEVDFTNTVTPAQHFLKGNFYTVNELKFGSSSGAASEGNQNAVILSGDFGRGGEFSGLLIYCDVDFGHGEKILGDPIVTTDSYVSDRTIKWNGHINANWKQGIFLPLPFVQPPGLPLSASVERTPSSGPDGISATYLPRLQPFDLPYFHSNSSRQ